VVLTTTAISVNSCVPQPTKVVLTPPTVTVGCVNPSAVTLKAELVSVDGHVLPTPLALDPSNAQLPVGVSTVRWTGTAPVGTVGTASQTVTVGVGETAAACCGSKTVVQGTGLPDIMLRPLSGQFCMLGVGSFDLLVGGPLADSMFGGDGSDKITSGDTGSIVSGGPGADVLTTVAGATYGGAGGDIISMTGGGDLYGNEGDDDIVSILANHNIYPGPGRDVVLAGSGDDHVYIYDACELAAFEVLDGGFGNDTLHTPLPLLDLLSRGVIVLNFENIVVETNNRHLAECF
jgi:Ca2+-binding RTX toxin-like protein